MIMKLNSNTDRIFDQPGQRGGGAIVARITFLAKTIKLEVEKVYFLFIPSKATYLLLIATFHSLYLWKITISQLHWCYSFGS